jgi:hypothetical protein
MSETPREFVDRFSDEHFGEGEDGLLVMDGFDDCIIGVGQRFTDHFVVYDLEKVIAKLMEQGMSEEEAIEFHEFNQLGAWVGPGTPVFLHFPESA